MDHHNARALIESAQPTWGALRDHMMNRFFGDDDNLPDMSNVNRTVPIGRAWEVYDAAIKDRDPDACVDLMEPGAELIACNIVRDFGLPTPS